MKTIKIHLRIMAIFLSALMLLQGCTVYKSANVTLEEAVKSENRIKVKTKYNQTLKFKRIEVENGHYYGLKYIYGKMIKTQIVKENVEKIQLKDKTLSTILSIGIPPIIIIGVIAYALRDGIRVHGS